MQTLFHSSFMQSVNIICYHNVSALLLFWEEPKFWDRSRINLLQLDSLVVLSFNIVKLKYADPSQVEWGLEMF